MGDTSTPPGLRPLRRWASLVLLAGLAGVEARAQPLDSEGIQPNEVKRGAAVENAKLDLTLCAPEMDELSQAAESAALAEIAQDPQCRRAILRAQAAGLGKGQIVDLLMGASGVPDPDPGAPPTGGVDSDEE